MSSSEFKIDLKFFSTGIDEVINGFTKLKTAMDSANSGQTSLTKTSDSLGKTIEKQKPSLMQLGTSFGTVTAAGWSLYNAYDSLEKVKAASAKADVTAQKAAMAVTAAQKAYNDAVAKSGAGSKAAADAATKLAVAKENLTNKLEMAEIKAGDVSEAYAQFATTLPTMVLSVASAGTAFSKLVTDMGGIHAVGPRIISAMQGIGGGIKSVMLAGGGLGLVLTAIATAFVLLATNAFGIRDAINGFGKALGDALPGLKAFLDLIGGAANWFLNLINPVGEASAQLDTLGTSATGTGTAMEGTQTLVEGLNGAMVDQSAVVKDVITDFQNWQTQQAELEAAYQAWKDAQVTGNTDLVDSYNLTGEEITKFKERYAKEMEDAKKAAEDASKKAYEAWKKSIDDSREAVEGGYGVLKKGFDSVLGNIKSALDEGKKEYKKALNEMGLDPDNPKVMQAVVEWAVDTNTAESEMVGFSQYLLQNVDQLKNASGSTFSSMVTQWTDYVIDEKPYLAEAMQGWRDTMIQKMNEKIDAGQKPAQAFLESIQETLNPTIAKQIAEEFSLEFPETTVAEFEKGKPKIEAAVTTNITTPIATKIADGEKDAKTKLTALVQNAIIGPITAAKPKVETESVSIVGAFTKLVTDASTEIDKIGLAFTNIKWGDLGVTAKKFFDDLTTAFKNIKWDTLGADIGKWSLDAVVWLGATFTTKATEFGDGLKGGLEKYGWVKLGDDISGWLTTGITWVQTQITTLANTFGNKLGAAIKAFTGWADVGKSIWEAIAKGIDSAAKAIGGSLQGILDWIKGGLGGGGGTGGGMKTSPSPGYTKSAWTPGAPQLQGEVMFGTTASDTQTLGQAFVTLATVISTAMKTIITQIGVFATTTKTQFTALGTALTTLGTAFTTVGTTITTAMTTANTQIGVFSTTTKTQFTAVTVAMTALGTAFTTLGTTVTTAMTTLNTQVGVFATTTGTQFTAVGTKVTALGATFTAMATTITTATTKVNTQVGVMVTTFGTQTSAMTTKATTFASAMVTQFNKITTAMDAAKKSADALKKSIDALKDKTITITTRYVTSGSARHMHGGQFLSGGQHGLSGIIDRPTIFRGARMGEGFRPELVTVTPLTRGTGNHYGPTMGGGFGSPGGRGGGEVVNNITVVLDGRVIQRFVEKTALAGIGMQI